MPKSTAPEARPFRQSPARSRRQHCESPYRNCEIAFRNVLSADALLATRDTTISGIRDLKLPGKTKVG